MFSRGYVSPFDPLKEKDLSTETCRNGVSQCSSRSLSFLFLTTICMFLMLGTLFFLIDSSQNRSSGSDARFDCGEFMSSFCNLWVLKMSSDSYRCSRFCEYWLTFAFCLLISESVLFFSVEMGATDSLTILSSPVLVVMKLTGNCFFCWLLAHRPLRYSISVD